MTILDDVYQYLEGATRYDHYICCRCAFHDDSRPSMFVYEQTYYCKSCGATGLTRNLVDDLRKKQGVFVIKKQVDFHSPWRKWFKIYGDLDNIVNRGYQNLIKNHKTAYLTKRGITLKTIQQLRIGWLDDWIIIPFLDEYQNVIGATARVGETNNAIAKYCNVPNMQETLFVPSWELIKSQNKIYNVFGILDAVTLYQLNIASISTTTGKHVNPTLYDKFRKQIITVPDKGEEVDGTMLSSKLGWRGKTLKVDWPENTKDINDIFCRYSKEELLSLIGA